MSNGRVTTGSVEGWRSLVLENDELRVTVLPEKGADIYELVDLATEIDVLFKGPWGLQPPGAQPLEGSGDDQFLWNYEGGWQELFPSVNEACSHRGNRIPFHGEVASLPWDYDAVQGEGDEVAVRLWTRCRQTPFRLERIMRLRRGVPELTLEGTVVNESDQPACFVWGQHCVLGPLFSSRAVASRSRLVRSLPRRCFGSRRPLAWRRGSESRGLTPGSDREERSTCARSRGRRRRATTMST